MCLNKNKTAWLQDQRKKQEELESKDPGVFFNKKKYLKVAKTKMSPSRYSADRTAPKKMMSDSSFDKVHLSFRI